jgi:hypothetical protein
MKRRAFITLIGGTAAWPLTASAHPRDNRAFLFSDIRATDPKPAGTAA